MPKMDLGQVVSIVTAVPKIVEGLRALFGKGKSGAEKKKIGVDLLKDSVGLTNVVAGKDVLSQPGTQALLEEAIQIGYDIMKLKDRLAAIESSIKGTVVKALPDPDQV